ncbi:MAG: choice-of-anchor B family protein [Candidatus Eisenbacteria bacterium]|uniref:Choice-of-anchor B family protein n=1 Tax=Eiseniibacteriota bacterium TaxID=2212470 RepID=A0A538STH2_UNCEI|nr:MAG: choice-of-anchor B family protein [Candidatus Eisenbacteria bacterium]
MLFTCVSPAPHPAVRVVRLVFIALLLLLAGPASAQRCRNVTLLSHMNLYGSSGYSSCWSYVHSDGREYAFEFAQTGASVVRLTDPANPVEVAFFNLADSRWHEGRQYQHWFYITTEITTGRNFGGLTIIDMADPDHPHTVSSFHSNLYGAHTIELDTARGLLYAAGAAGASGQGLYIYSLADPTNPVLLTVYGNGFPDYIHTIHVDGLRGYASMGILGTVRILDLTDPAHPTTITEFGTPGGLTPGTTLSHGSTHSAWNSVDGRYLYVTDEVSGVGLYVYDLLNLSNIRQVYRYEGLPPRTVAHDPVIRGNLQFQAYYTAGARVYDVSNPAWPAEIGYYDTFPGRDGGFQGCWEAAPMFPSGIFIASDIETGLYVLRVNTNYGIVRGTVQQAPNGPVIVGAAVTQGAASTVSFSDGRYSIVVDPGSAVALTFSQFGYETLTKTLSVTPGSDQTFNASLRLKDAGTLSGVVQRGSDASPLSEAEIAVLGTPLRALTDANGAFTIASIPVGSYQVRCVRAGQVPRVLAATITKGSTTALSYFLASPLSYDDVEADRGWVLGDKFDDATTGLWVRGVPNGTIYIRTGEPIQPGRDHTPDPGAACFVTGNALVPSTNSLTDCVQGGQTTLTSPALHLGGFTDPRIGYWRWYANYFFEFTPDDPLVTQLSNDGGQTWVSVDSLYEPPSGWTYTELNVANTFAHPGDVFLRFIAQNRGDFGLVEAAIDDISSYSGSGIGAQAAPAAPVLANMTASMVGRPHPSPTHGPAGIDLALARTARVRADVFDVQGRLVRTIQDGTLTAGLHVLSWDGSIVGGSRGPAGSYWVRISSEGVTTSSRLVVLR